ncbi:MAG: hypothetical protein VX569_06620, partial [Pseudomonadota bacterium]|nr:hypothetical protein [Pseudomonadota bacterium]
LAAARDVPAPWREKMDGRAVPDTRAATPPLSPGPAPAGQAAGPGEGAADAAGGNLPGGGGVKPEYANSGRWIARP